MNVTLIRDLDDGKCTLGTIDLFGTILQSLERPWVPGSEGGMPGRSCIPAGKYQLVLHDTEAHPRTFAMVNEALGVYHYNVPQGKQGRTACLIHIANRPAELRGCIAFGMKRALLGNDWMIQQSKIAVDTFYAKLPWIEGHTLTIEDRI